MKVKGNVESKKKERIMVNYLCDGDVEIEFEGEDGSCQEHHKHHKSSVLKIGQLYLHRTKLHPPTNTGVGGRRLETHALPVSGLDILQRKKGVSESVENSAREYREYRRVRRSVKK